MRLAHPTRRPAITAAVGLALAVALSGCVSTAEDQAKASSGGDSGQACENGEVLIGSAMARTGFMAPFDSPALDTAKIAIDRINGEGGVDGCQLKLKEVDGESNPDKIAQITTDLTSQGAKLMLVTCDYDVSAKAAQIAEAAGVLTIAPCIGDTVFGPDAGLDLGFSMGSAVPGEAAIMAEYAYETYGPKAALFKDMTIKYTQNQCSAFQTRWEELGGTVVAAPEFSQTPEGSLAAPVSAQVKEIGSSDADVVALCSYPGGGAEALGALRKAGIDTPVISGFGMDGAFWLGAVPDLSNFTDVTYASVFGDDPNEKVQSLLADYKKMTGEDAATSGLVTGASTIEAFAEAAKQAGSFDGAALADALESFDNVELTAGPTSFSQDLHVNVTRPMAVIDVNGGKHSFVEYRAAEKPVLQ